MKNAGLVLGLLVIPTWGATGPWALVLSGEWLFDRRRPHPVFNDIVGASLGAGGTVYFTFLTVALWGYSLTYPLIQYHTVAFFAWLTVRAFTRWRDIAANG